jgi:uncharacterized protein YjaG (DUF416 family)
MKNIYTSILDMIWNYLTIEQSESITSTALATFDGSDLKGLYCAIAEGLMDHLPEDLSLEVAGKCMKNAGF